MSDEALQEAQSLIERGDRLGARGLIVKQLSENPDQIHALHLMSTLEMEDGRIQEATVLVQRVLTLSPDHAPAIYNLGVCQMTGGHNELALSTFNRALDVDPNHSGALYNVGALLRQAGDVAKASTFFQRLVKLNPNWVSAWEGFCETLKAQHRYADVIAACDVLVRQSKATPLIYRLRAEANLGMGDLVQAETNLILSYRADERDPDTLICLAGVLRMLGRPKQAIPLYERVLVLSAQNRNIIDRFDPALSELIQTCRAIGEWQLLSVYEEQAVNRLVSENGAIHPHTAAPITDDPAALLRAARHSWPKATYAPKMTERQTNGASKSRPIRVGLFSSSFGENAATHTLTALTTGADKKRFEFYGYNAGAIGSANSELKAACNLFRNIRTESPEAIAVTMASDELDLMINLMGFESHSRAAALAYRPVPVVASYYAFPGSMGSKHIDYLIADEVLVPTGDETGYDEVIVRLPGGSRAIRPNSSVQISRKIRMNYGLKSDVPVFCAFADVSSMGSELLTLYAKILKDTPGSQIWLLVDNLQARTNIRNLFTSCGIGADRIVFADGTSPSENEERMALADLALDSFPLSRQPAVSNALLAGLPVLTRKGRSFASRVGASLLTAAGLPELVTDDASAFHAKAVELVSAPRKLSDIRATLSANRATSPAFDILHLRRHLERAFEMMVERNRQGLAPVSFSVPGLS